ncbi:MAG: EpsI family protein [Bryobacter sp.]|nr:EpsI family protein [Bryobacter sp.]
MLKLNPKQLLSPPVLVISGILVAQALLFANFSRIEKVPVGIPLAQFPERLGGWLKIQEGYVDDATQAVLQADDLLSRSYGNPSLNANASLFIASFRSQRTGVAPHSPKNCLPGNGWTPIVDDRIPVKVEGMPQPIEVNRYIIQRGDSRSLVLYWFQSRNRAVASEFHAKFYTMRDALLENRTDTALVRVILPLRPEANLDEARRIAEDFIRSVYGPIIRHLPS